MVRTSTTTLYSSATNTTFPNPSLNLQFCHNATQILSLKNPLPLINKQPFLQYCHHHHQKNPTSGAINFRSLVIKASSSSSSMASSTKIKPFSVLFVCLGNICRSPAAEGVFTDIVKKRGLDSEFKIDSAGTIDYHEGNPADPRMRAASRRRGVEITSISRPIRPSDFRDFDIILAMDNQNREDIMEAFNRWKFRETLPDDAHKKVKLMCSFCKKHEETEVPDPYYGGPQGFEKVLDLLEDACESLLDNILVEKN
ncbi:PREDICTED: low molecular weight phosphotyrosine protein phosphatase [Populus euphratica]|uniref:acid phosphatase n=1 Tax=Populus euphratica TaxID=75702 RepID=A0AAJ6VBC9_POPEU|nr:PREDICTED: low molecular weight phosphotyrosine protein phosphatase [Populus euphratica]